jgi:hypothetical protein
MSCQYCNSSNSTCSIWSGQGVRRGGTLVTARVPDGSQERLEAALSPLAVDIQQRRAAWQASGWKSFDSASEPFGAEQVRRERALYGAGR